MHPLITARLKLKELLAIKPRSWSPYYPQWLRMEAELRRFIAELEDSI